MESQNGLRVDLQRVSQTIPYLIKTFSAAASVVLLIQGPFYFAQQHTQSEIQRSLKAVSDEVLGRTHWCERAQNPIPGELTTKRMPRAVLFIGKNPVGEIRGSDALNVPEDLNQQLRLIQLNISKQFEHDGTTQEIQVWESASGWKKTIYQPDSLSRFWQSCKNYVKAIPTYWQTGVMPQDSDFTPPVVRANPPGTNHQPSTLLVNAR